MKKYIKEIIVLIIQLFMFYIFPLFAGPTDAMGMVVLILLSTFILSIIIGAFSKEELGYLYPVIIAILFIPSVFIFYNESALVHAIWYFVDSLLGMALGICIKKLTNKKFTWRNKSGVVLFIFICTIVILFSYKYIDKDGNTTEPYIPDGLEVADKNEMGNTASTQNFNRSVENITIEVIEDTITNESAEIVITDNNQDHYGWGVDFRIQKKDNDKWEDLKPIRELSFIEIAYVVGEDNQLKMKVDYGHYYGTLEKGTYRIVKPIYDKKYIDLYSNEFEINL